MEPTGQQRGVSAVVIHYFMANFGYFGLLSSLVVMLTAKGLQASQVALLMALFTFANKVAKIPLAPWLDGSPAPRSVLTGCVIAAVGLATLGQVQQLPLMALALMLAGVGISINNLASKQLGAAVSDSMQSRARLFSVINVAVNVASAVAAPLALYLVDRKQYGWVAAGIAATYVLAGVLTWLRLHRVAAVMQKAGSSNWRTYRNLLQRPGLRAFLLINAFGWFLYGQLFNTLALYVSSALDSASKLGWLYSLNAVLIVTLQLPLTHIAERWQGGRPMRQVTLAFTVFMLAFIAAWAVPGYPGAVVFVVLFTLAEMLFIPSVDVLLLGLIGQESRAVAYSILSISTAVGESLGGGFGVTTWRWMSNHNHMSEFWLLVAGMALVFVGVTGYLQRSSAGLRAIPQGA
ncbi:MFS transporter [Amantichitinum ursilacus]|uniref:Major Facilitator Superfamily protein n=1 Tax=Amantichitinum ursilacus TaxID=857265 RepID=A0A0N0XKF0_9NEIS|nr:MFS transporter [Amantichitinum ursilacus]KPC52719.1 Major Facilitator Superfamily protein [Amantichitinum ursilacus]